MPGSHYIALSGLRTRVDQLDRLASDLANMGTTGYKGEHDTSAIRFPFVYRNMEKAKTFLVTLEVQPRPARDAAASAPAN